jgi:hypothetical protein
VFAAKLALFLALVTACQGVVYATYHAKHLPRGIRMAELVAAEAPDVVYFGDSTVTAVCPGSESKGYLAALVAKKIAPHSLLPLEDAAFQAHVFKRAAAYLEEQGVRPKAVVIPVNLRCFSAQWHLNPYYQFVRDRYFLSHTGFWERAALQPLAVLRSVDLAPVTLADQAAVPVENRDGTVSPLGDLMAIAQNFEHPDRRHHIFNFSYVYDLSPEHPRVRDLVETVRTVLRIGAQPVLYVTPIDCESGNRHYGPDFTDRIKASVAVLDEVLQAEGVRLMDLSDEAPAAWFCYGKGMDEHLTYEGLQLVSSEVARALDEEVGLEASAE